MLLPSPIHGQVLTFAAGDRDLIDLLAVSCEGRLAVLELKITEDLHLPMQALDYWMRIRWHAERNELQHLFPGIPLAHTLPKLLLVAPAIAVLFVIVTTTVVIAHRVPTSGRVQTRQVAVCRQHLVELVFRALPVTVPRR